MIMKSGVQETGASLPQLQVVGSVLFPLRFTLLGDSPRAFLHTSHVRRWERREGDVEQEM